MAAAQVEAKRLLLSGTCAQNVLEFLRKSYTTPSSMKRAITSIRQAIFEDNDKSHIDYSPLATHLYEPGVISFLQLNLKEQVETQRSRRGPNKSLCSEAAEAAIQRLQLLPENLQGLHITHVEQMDLDQAEANRVLHTNEDLLVIPDANTLLCCAIQMLQRATVHSTFGELVIPLLLVCGRRETELLNGRSTFSPVAHTHGCVFAGALKKRGKDGKFVIPLLVPYTLFAHGLTILRQKQGSVAHMTNREIATRYNGTINCSLQKQRLGPVFAPIHNAHKLRPTYCALIFHYYTCTESYNRVIMRICGHERIEESLAYTGVSVQGGGAGSFGPLLF